MPQLSCKFQICILVYNKHICYASVQISVFVLCFFLVFVATAAGLKHCVFVSQFVGRGIQYDFF